MRRGIQPYIIRRLIEEHGCDPEHQTDDGCTCLWTATKHGHFEVIQYLLEERHVDPNVPNNIMHSTPMIIACEKGFLEIARLLKQHGADLSIRMNDGDTVIHLATQNRHVAVVQQLLEWGCSPNVVNDDRQTPIKIAVQTGRLSLVRMLLDAGAGKTLAVGGAELVDKGNEMFFPLNAIEAAGYLCGVACFNQEDAEAVEFDLGTAPEVMKPFEIATAVAEEMMVLAPGPVRGAVPSGSATENNVNRIVKCMSVCGFVAVGLSSDEKPLPAEVTSTVAVLRDVIRDLPVKIDEYCVSPPIVRPDCSCSRRASAKANRESALSESEKLAPTDKSKPSVFDNLHNNGGSSNSSTAQPSTFSGEGPDESSAEVRARGNAALKKTDFAEALRLYETAIVLDPTCALAASNAAEAALRLQRFSRAHEHASLAFGLDKTHEKTWARLMRSLARLQRAAEAYVWIADRAAGGLFGEQTVLDLSALVADESPLCFGFKKGMYVCRAVQEGGYAVRTAVAISAKDTLTQERAVVPWDSELAKDRGRLEHFLRTATPADFKKLNGLCPRRFEDIPPAVKSLSKLEDTVKAYFARGGKSYRSADKINTKREWERDLDKMCETLSSKQAEALRSRETARRALDESNSSKPMTDDEIREYVRVLAIAKLCAHDDGIHHFGGFYNHSCAPNCEVRGREHLVIVATRAIAPGEELCISYAGQDQQTLRSDLDLSVVCRRLLIERGWGGPCFCLRCVEELEALGGGDVEDGAHGEAAWMRFQTAMMDAKDACEKPDPVERWLSPNPHVAKVGQFGNLLNALDRSGSAEILRDWRAVPWKESYVLGFLSGQRAMELQMLSKGARTKAAALRLWEKLEADQALEGVSRLYELRRRYMGAASASLQFENLCLMTMLSIYVTAGKTKPALGLRTVDAMRERMVSIQNEAVFQIQ